MRLLQVGRLSVLKNGQTGLESQDKNSKKAAEDEGHTVVASVEEYAKGPSDPFQRKQLGPWLTDPAKIVQYDGIIAAKVDRLFRSSYQASRLRRWCEEHGKTLIVASPQLRWPCDGDPGMKIIWVVLEALGEAEWDTISGRYRDMQAFLKSGGAVTNKPPFGFDVAGESKHKYLAPNDEGRRIVPEIFRLCIAGKSLDDIARWLEAAGAETRAHRTWRLAGPGTRDEEEPRNEWWGNTIRQIIRNPVYMGRWCEYKRETDPKHPGRMKPVPGQYGAVIMEVEPLVDALTWDRANEAMSKRGQRKPRSASPAMLSGGVLFCLECGGPMYRLGDPAARQAYYRCAGRGTKRTGCGAPMPRMDAVDGAVNRFIAGSDRRIPERRVITGNDWAAEIKTVQFDLRKLPDRGLTYEEEDIERARLRGVLDELRTREPVPDRVEVILTDRTFAQDWAGLATEDRCAWLKKVGLKIRANREQTEIHDDNGTNWGGPILHQRTEDDLNPELAHIALTHRS